MNYRKFIAYNLVGGLLWVFGFVFLGYFFGTLPIVQENFEIALIAIVLLSIVPALWEALAPRLRGNRQSASHVD